MEDQINHQTDVKTNQPTGKSSSTATILDAVSGVFAVGGAVASVITQQVAIAAFPLALSVGVHLLNRRQSMNALEQHIEQMILQQNLHVVQAEQKLQAVEEKLGQFQKESWLALETQAQEYKAMIAKVSEEIKQLQQQTSNLDQSVQSLESKQQQLTDVVEELRQIENYSQALQTEPSVAHVHYQRGFSLQRLGNKEGAIADYSQAIQLDPKYAAAYHSRGVLYGELGKRKLAVADLRQASKLYFDQGDIDSYQKARDLGKELYDLRDVMEEQVVVNPQSQQSDAEKTNNGNNHFKTFSSISVDHLFG